MERRQISKEAELAIENKTLKISLLRNEIAILRAERDVLLSREGERLGCNTDVWLFDVVSAEFHTRE